MTDAIAGTAIDLTVGDVHISRIEEAYGPTFPATMVLPGFSQDAVDNHGAQTFGQFWDPASQLLLMSIHTWLVRTPRSTILIDTCNGNHKQRPNMPDMSNLDTPWLQRLAAAGVQPGQVDYVICTHLHLDHVGWNTSLVNGEWVPTFPNATYVFNKTEFEFWKPDNPANAPLEFNSGVFDDSVAPVFDRSKTVFWDGSTDIDEVFHLEVKPGHTPGNAIAWLSSKGQHACFSGDTMHSPMQVFEPGWNSGFDIVGEQAEASRRQVLEACVERNAYLLPAHFSAPHVYKVQPKGNGLAAVSAV